MTLTQKQEERIRAKIKQIKAALAADKKFWHGFYHDGQGLRYGPPRLYIQLGDYTGGLRYFNWFNKNFPDDAGYPDFLFEWALILFKTHRHNEAKKKVLEAFTRNTYIFDKFFGRPIVPIEKWEGSNLETSEFVINYFQYSDKQENLLEFAEWLDELIYSERLKHFCDEYIEIYKSLKHEHEYKKRVSLIDKANKLEASIKNIL